MRNYLLALTFLFSFIFITNVLHAQTHWVKVESGSEFSVALNSDGQLFSWGRNNAGQLGLGQTYNKTVPTLVDSNNTWLDVAAGAFHVLAIKSDGTLWSWGRNSNGQLGHGNTTNLNVPTQVENKNDWIHVFCGQSHSLALKADSSLYAWGYNFDGSVGNGTTTDVLSPVAISSSMKWIDIDGGAAHTLGIDNQNNLWAWGSNDVHQLGYGYSNISKDTPTQVSLTGDWTKVSAGYKFSFAIKNDGTLWSWGRNVNGQIGHGSSGGFWIPWPIDSTYNWWKVDAGANYTLALKKDSTLWAWGKNNSGQLGLGDLVQRNLPVQVDSNTNWFELSAAEGAYSLGYIGEHSHALSYPADLICSSGANYAYQLGSGSLTSVNVFTCGTVILTAISNHDIAQDAIRIYPNPTCDFVYVDSDKKIEMLELFDIQGNLIERMVPNTFYPALDVSGYATGVYVLKMYYEGGVARKRFVKN